ncbi:aminoglycoside 6-adenylyltransferase [Tenacibaculum sp. C7A-26P2]|uniref:aminoglycoside 6-adenylyltransferase n=1 Tax=Tenacibaculum sp. C7A-26P2 TaxID=3447504 RepID=UPI003F85CBE1
MVEEIKHFAKKNEDICAIISFGSLHNGDLSNSDEFSDLDLFVFTTAPEKYLNSENIKWLYDFGNPLSVLVINNPVEKNMINRVMLDNYFSFDIIPISYKKFSMVKFFFLLKQFKLTGLLKNKGTIIHELKTFYSYLSRGYTILYDKKNITELIFKIKTTYKEDVEDLDISKIAFEECYHDFWQNAFKFLGKIIRNEVYYGIVRIDDVLKKRLIKMLEWEAKLYYKYKGDTYFDGKKVSEWVSAETMNDLKKTTFNFNQRENINTLRNHIEIFQKASKNVAAIKHYSRSENLEKKIIEKLNEYSL